LNLDQVAMNRVLQSQPSSALRDRLSDGGEALSKQPRPSVINYVRRRISGAGLATLPLIWARRTKNGHRASLTVARTVTPSRGTLARCRCVA